MLARRIIASNNEGDVASATASSVYRHDDIEVGLKDKHFKQSKSHLGKLSLVIGALVIVVVVGAISFAFTSLAIRSEVNETSLDTVLEGGYLEGGKNLPKSSTKTISHPSSSLNPLFSIEPLKKSLHPIHKLWTEMDTEQQNDALQYVGKYMAKYAQLIAPKGVERKQWNSLKHGNCIFAEDVGKDGHTLCGPRLHPPCNFISFGINDNPSFDIEVGNWGCRGFAADPTVQHPSKLHKHVTFHNIAATMLQDNEERLINKGGDVEWWYTSFPKLRYFLGMEKIDILKIDCEGCEVALSRDILREDPHFLHHVDQISIETHVTKNWMTTREHVYYFGLLLVLLEEAGFVMEWSSVFGCSKRHEVTGCVDELVEFGWPCGYDPWPGHPNVVQGRSCQEFTWKRYG